QLLAFLESEYGPCVNATSVPGEITAKFTSCPGPYERGELDGELHIRFDDAHLGDVLRDIMFLESAGVVTLWGHRMTIRYYATGSETIRFPYGTDTKGTTADGIAFDLSLDPDETVPVHLVGATGAVW